LPEGVEEGVGTGKKEGGVEELRAEDLPGVQEVRN